ncbi:MAG: PHB depolymerase family esterase [Alphaproteobacteria bacterium]|nr:PHB depolymerase family esterase [Alphaproteobacteria bacterium]
MFDKLPPDMAEALRLTRAGRLADATALIRRQLPGAKPVATDADFTDIDLAPLSVELSDLKAPEPPPTAAPTPAATLREALRGFRGRATPASPLPAGASFEAHVFTSQDGTRGYKLYIPANRPDGPVPLVVMLHGCTQSPDDFATGTRMNLLAEEHGCLVAYPEQPSSANHSKCWNWFSPEHQGRGAGEPSLIAGITRGIIAEHPIDPGRVYVAGLSAGGAAAAIMGATHPDLFAAVGVHSGLACGSARDLPSALAAMRQGGARSAAPGKDPIPMIVFHGDQDTTVHPRNGEAVVAQAVTRGASAPATERGQVPGGHSYTRLRHADPSGRVVCEQWTIHGAGHAWAGGAPAGSYTDPRGPDASREMLRFFLEHRRGCGRVQML